MPGRTAPAAGIQAFHAMFDGLRQRLTSLEAWQRQTRGIPTGTITRWGGATAPAGAFLCNGASFDPVRFPALAAVLGGSTLPTVAGTPIYDIWT